MPENGRNHNFENTVWIILIKNTTCRTRNRHSNMIITTGSGFKNSGLKENSEINRECRKMVEIIILIKNTICEARNRHSHMIITTGSGFKNSGLKENSEIDRECQKMVEIIILKILC